MSYEHLKAWRIRTKNKIVDSMGGKCCGCDQRKENELMDLHHLDPQDKDFNLSDAVKDPISWEKIVKELRKCILLCKDCHIDVHSKYNLFVKNPISFNELFFVQKNDIGENLCIECGEIISRKAKRCVNCRGFLDRKVERPSAEELHKMVWSEPTEKIAQRLGVTGKAIEKWCKSLGVEKPPRGYWTKISIKQKSNLQS